MKEALPAAQSPPRISVGAQATSLSVSTDATGNALRVVVAGRDVLQTCTADESGTLTEELNLLQHTRRHTTNHASNDVLWFPKRPSQLVSGSSSGAVLLWDTVKSGNKLSRTLTGHQRAVNRMCFHPSEPRLLSCSQDCTAKLWDFGLRSGPQLSFTAAAEVRDVQMCRSSPVHFATALENGLVQLFDLRSNRQSLQQWQAHHGPVYTLEFHPDYRAILATGGRDRMIRVWNTEAASASSAELQHGAATTAVAFPALPACWAEVQTIAPVSRLKWRSDLPSDAAGGSSGDSTITTHWRIASCANRFDHKVLLWIPC